MKLKAEDIIDHSKLNREDEESLFIGQIKNRCKAKNRMRHGILIFNFKYYIYVTKKVNNFFH